MANTAASIVIPEKTPTVLTAVGGTRWRINNSCPDTLFVRLSATDPTPNPGGYDIAIPRGRQYISDLNEYVGPMRAWCNQAGTVTLSIDA